MEKILIKSFKEPTNIYILGCYFEEWENVIRESFSITDDYIYIDIKNIGNGKESMFETDGCVIILAENDFIKYAKLTNVNENHKDLDTIFIENYVGDINLVYVLDEKLNLYLKQEDFNVKDYLMYQEKAQDYEDISYYMEINAPQSGLKGCIRTMFSDKKHLFKSFEIDNL